MNNYNEKWKFIITWNPGVFRTASVLLVPCWSRPAFPWCWCTACLCLLDEAWCRISAWFYRCGICCCWITVLPFPVVSEDVYKRQAVDNNMDLFVCNFSEHWLLLDDPFLLGIWIIVWWRFAHVLQENLEGQWALSWPRRKQFRQSLFLFIMFFLSCIVSVINCEQSVIRCLPLHSWHMLFPTWEWNIALAAFTVLITLR